MDKKSENNNAKTQAKEALEKIKANLPQSNNKFGPEKSSGFKPNARLGSINRSRR